MGDVTGGKIGAGAGPVLDDDRLPELCRHALADDAGDDVRPAAGREADNQPDRTGRIIIRDGRRASQWQRGQSERRPLKIPA